MNGGGENAVGYCFEHYTGYHGQRSQEWGYKTAQILSSDTSNVPKDGLYRFDASTRSLSPSLPDKKFSKPIETGIPVLTIVSTW